MSIDDDWGYARRNRSSYNSAFPAWMSPTEIDRYQAEVERQAAPIRAERDERRRARISDEAARAEATRLAAWRAAVFPIETVCANLIDYMEAKA